MRCCLNSLILHMNMFLLTVIWPYCYPYHTVRAQGYSVYGRYRRCTALLVKLQANFLVAFLRSWCIVGAEHDGYFWIFVYFWFGQGCDPNERTINWETFAVGINLPPLLFFLLLISCFSTRHFHLLPFAINLFIPHLLSIVNHSFCLFALTFALATHFLLYTSFI